MSNSPTILTPIKGKIAKDHKPMKVKNALESYHSLLENPFLAGTMLDGLALLFFKGGQSMSFI
jgi:hypothetical protein